MTQFHQVYALAVVIGLAGVSSAAVQLPLNINYETGTTNSGVTDLTVSRQVISNLDGGIGKE